MTGSSYWRRVAAVAVLATALPAAHAVDVNARIRGTAVDPTGAAVPGVTVTATNQATGVKSTTKTNGNGEYTFQQLPIGTYTISATFAGFKTFAATGIVLNIDQEYVESIKFDVGSNADTVSVQADAVQVNTTDMQLNNVVDSKSILAYPLVGRSFTQLELIEPGVQAPSDRFGSAYSVNGAETQQSSYLINGADTNDFVLNTIGIEPNVDALDQFNLITGPLNAEYSRNSGAIVSSVVKQGTNQFHGDAFEFYRDTFLNTPGFFNYSTITNAAGNTVGIKTRPVFHQNEFGGVIGGPILRDKVFFLGAYQGIREREPQTSNASGVSIVPTVAQRAGNFAGTTLSNNLIPGTISIPGCISNVGGNTATADTFSSCFAKLNGVLPASAFNPISAKLLSTYVPAPNSGSNQYTFNPITKLVEDQATLRVDVSPNQKNQIDFVGIYQHEPSSDTTPFTGPSLPGFGDVDTSEIRQFTGDWTRQLSSSAVNVFSLHYTRFNLGAVKPQNTIAPSAAGFAIAPQDAANESLPLISVSGNFAIGFSTNGPQPRVDQTYQIDESFSKVIGKHSLKVGYDGRRFNVDNEFDATNSGSYAFSNSSATNPNTSGNSVLDFLLGNVSSYAQTANGRIDARSFENYVYAQDTWKVTPSLTLDYGIGYQIDTAIHNTQFGGEGVNCFIPGQQSKVFASAPLSLNFPGDPGCNNAQGATTPYSDFGPRFGFAYAPDLGFLSGGNSKKLSIRGGYGIYYNRTEEEGSLQNLNQVPFGFSSSGIRDVQANPTDRPAFANPYQNINTGSTIANPFPASFPKPGATNVTFPGNPLYISQYAPNYRVPYAENYQLTIERELAQQIVFKASYVGSVSRHNQDTIEGNPITSAGQAACLASPACIADQSFQNSQFPTHTQFPQAINPATGSTHFHSDALIQTEGASSYNALELSLTKGVTHGLSGQVSYTLAHALDNVSSYEGGGFGGERGYNQYQPSLNYGNADFDTRHRLVIAPIYDFPKLHGSSFSPLNLVASGWEVTGIMTLATGHPFDISYQGGESYALYCSDGDFYYTCPDVPNQIAPLKRTNPHQVGALRGQFFNGDTNEFQLGLPNIPGASFADENTGQFGNISRNKFFGPGIINLNAQLSKNIPVSGDGTRYIQLRIEAYNVTNHTNFANPAGNPDLGSTGNVNNTGTFGVITALNSSLTTREYQLAGKFYF